MAFTAAEMVEKGFVGKQAPYVQIVPSGETGLRWVITNDELIYRGRPVTQGRVRVLDRTQHMARYLEGKRVRYEASLPKR